MKRILPWVIGVACIGVALAFVLRGGSSAPMKPAVTAMPSPAQVAAPSAPTPAPADHSVANAATTGAEKIAYTFPDEAKMREFATLMQQRQALALRMAVAQDYWNAEQAALAEIDKKLAADYQLDTKKNYFLDAQRKVLVERETPPATAAGTPAAPAPTQPVAPAPAAPAAPAQEKIAYTFTDDAKMKEFTTSMQQRQGVALRMAVLQDYWNQDKAAMDQLDKRLTDTYKLDLKKNYSLDANRRVLLEVELPPASQPAAPSPAGQAPAAPSQPQ